MHRLHVSKTGPATSAKEAWTALQSYHQKASLTNQVFLFKKNCSMKLSETGDIESHLNAMLGSVDQLAAVEVRH